MLYPSLWQDNPLVTSAGNSNSNFTAEPGAIGVSTDPFVWVPPPFDPVTGTSPCLIGIATTPMFDNPLTGITGITDLALALAHNTNVAQRNVRLVVGNQLQFTDAAAYEHGSEAATVMFGMQFENMPEGSSFTLATTTPFDSGASSTSGPIQAGSSNITWGPFDIPAGWSSTLSYTVDVGNGATAPPKVTLGAYLVSAGGETGGANGPAKLLLAGSVCSVVSIFDA